MLISAILITYCCYIYVVKTSWASSGEAVTQINTAGNAFGLLQTFSSLVPLILIGLLLQLCHDNWGGTKLTAPQGLYQEVRVVVIFSSKHMLLYT